MSTANVCSVTWGALAKCGTFFWKLGNDRAYWVSESLGSLSRLQQDFLVHWFAHTHDYFLTGGAALIAALGVPRTTKDLDLFTISQDAFELSDADLRSTCKQLSAKAEALRTAPHFRRYRVSRGDERTLIDLVHDEVPQLFPDKLCRQGILYDQPEEVLVNKICSIVGRGEARDFVDTYFLASKGFDPNVALARAYQKDGGVDAGTLLYVLSDVNWERFQAPGVERGVVRATADFFQEWMEHLAQASFPSPLTEP